MKDKVMWTFCILCCAAVLTFGLLADGVDYLCGVARSLEGRLRLRR